MPDKDVVSKFALQRIALDLARYLFDMEVDEVTLVESEYQRVEQRRADLVVQASGTTGNFLLHIEIQNDNDPQMPQRMLRYYADIAFAHPHQDIRQYLIYIGRTPLTMADGIARPNHRFRYTIVDMHQVDCETFLRQDNPDALIMAILCDFKGRPERDVIRYVLQRLRQLLGENEKGFRNYLSMLEILSTNRNLQQAIREEEEMLSKVELTELPSYTLGLERGQAQGLEQGLEQGREQGREQGLQQGEVTVLLRLLEKKFGPVPAELRQIVEQADTDTLLEWSERFLTATSIEEIVRWPSRK